MLTFRATLSFFTLLTLSILVASSAPPAAAASRSGLSLLDILDGKLLSPQSSQRLAERLASLTPHERERLRHESRRSQKEYLARQQTTPSRRHQNQDSVQDGPDFSGVPAFLKGFMQCRQISGLGVAVVQGGKIVFSQGFGIQNAAGKPVDTDTIFGIGSCTKAFTSTLGALMKQDGKFDFDALLTDYLPDLSFADPDMMKLLTPLDLFTHRTGLAKHDLALFLDQKPTRRERVYAIKYIEPSAPIRSRFLYNNWQILIAGYILGQIGSRDGTWETLIQDRIFYPLGMSRTFANFSLSVNQPNRATPMTLTNGEWVDELYEWNEIIDQAAPAGAIASSVNDMAQWALVHLGHAQDFLSNSSRQYLHAPKMTISESASLPSWLAQFVDGSNYAVNW